MLCLNLPYKRANPLLVVGNTHLPVVHIFEELVALCLEVRNELEGLFRALTRLARLHAERVLEVLDAHEKHTVQLSGSAAY
jgi:hypothetical protein